MEGDAPVSEDLCNYSLDVGLTLGPTGIFVKFDSFTEEFNSFFVSLLFELKISLFLQGEELIIDLLVVYSIYELFIIYYWLFSCRCLCWRLWCRSLCFGCWSWLRFWRLL